MDNILFSTAILPGLVACLLFLLFSYLHEQSRQPYFRAWQLAWAAYTLHFLLNALGAVSGSHGLLVFVSSLLMVGMAVAILISTRLTRRLTSAERREAFRLRWYEAVVAGAGGLFAVATAVKPQVQWLIAPEVALNPFQIAVALILGYSSFDFYRTARRKGSIAFRLLSFAVALWAVLITFGQFKPVHRFGGDLLGPLPQMLLGLAMVMVLFENERNAVQENALAFSKLDADPMRLLSATDLVPSMQRILDRLVAPLPTTRAVICISERWRAVLPSVQFGFSPEFATKLDAVGAGEYVCELAYRRGGFVSFRNLPEMSEPLPAFPGGRFEQFREAMVAENIRNATAVSLQTREHNFGVILFPHTERRLFGESNLRLLVGLALQIGLTLENYVVMHDAQRRTKEYQLLTQIGQAISSRLNQGEVLRTVQKELGQIFDTSNFYVAFLEADSIVFELQVEDGQNIPKHRRKIDNGLTEYIIRTGQPLLVRSDLERARERLGVSLKPTRPAKSFCGVPILVSGKATGVMAAMSMEREYVFEPRDLEVLKTAAGQVSVAIENARLFAEEQRRTRQFAFLNSVSKTAISSEDAEQMLAEIVSHIQKNFQFDHIGIGILDYATKEIEIKAEAGSTAQEKGKKIPVGTGIIGRVARTGETALLHATEGGQLQSLLPTSRTVLCMPITYGESLLGILNIESAEERAVSDDDVLVMNTLADLLATALHNSFVFQKLQQQSITDGLTGIKTRRFFWEALSAEWKRASRSGRPFSVVLVDLDKFKEVNDSTGHLEGDLVLARVGRLLENKCRQSNVVARYGGDEFIILMPETSVEQAQILAERLRLWLATDPMLSEHKITGSFGVASFPIHGFSAESIIRVADMGMYISKKAGGDRVSTAEEFEREEGGVLHRQLVSGYIEAFLQRERTGPEHLEEMVNTLRKLATSTEDKEAVVLKDSIETLARAAESRELHASGHGEAVAQYCEMIGRALNMAPADIRELSFAARVHDLGKMFVPERVLNKQGSLSDEEFELVKSHPRFAGEILSTLPDGARVKRAVECHHEHLDGSGFPSELRGDDIPLWARIIAVANTYVNLTSDRGLTPPKTSDQAIIELERGSGTKYDGMLVRVLARELKSERSVPNVGS
ncbi:MAG TPA: diguanylate cyclase [Terriglobales bacterium]|nr:diguanylate cyclase [Terriglobales bacterium]